MSLLENKITTHKHARWFAVIAYFVGMVMIMAGHFLNADWSAYLMVAGLFLWVIPVMWSAYMWSKDL